MSIQTSHIDKAREFFFTKQRRSMVKNQLINKDCFLKITNKLVLKAMLKVSRHLFMPKTLDLTMSVYDFLKSKGPVTGLTKEQIKVLKKRPIQDEVHYADDVRAEAYADRAISIGKGQTISQPYTVAAMTQLLELEGGETVLEIGAGSGYQAAILAEIADEVITIDKDPDLAARARRNLAQQGYKNVLVIVGDGTLGYKKKQPYDRIIVTAGAPKIPMPLFDQLAINGYMVIPCGKQHDYSLYSVLKKSPLIKDAEIWKYSGYDFVPLIGMHGWHINKA